VDFYPEETHGLNLSRYSQGAKWIKEMDPDLRPQMAEKLSNKRVKLLFSSPIF
jgi:hypothetical protein